MGSTPVGVVSGPSVELMVPAVDELRETHPPLERFDVKQSRFGIPKFVYR